jgi:hypothetical protein
MYAIACCIQHERMGRLLKTVLIGIALCFGLGAVVVAEGLWVIWDSAWSTVMGVLFLASLVIRRPVLGSLLPQTAGLSSRRSSVVLTSAWGMAFLFEGWLRVWSRSGWPFEHFLAAVPAVSYVVIAGLIAWSFWYTSRVEQSAQP